MGKDNFKEFKENTMTIVADKLGSNVCVSLIDARKNNGIILCGLNIRGKDENIGPVVYLEQYYEMYKDGASYDEIADNIIDIFNKSRYNVKFDVEQFEDFEYVSKKLVYKMINYEANAELLAKAVHRRVLDLAIVYYYMGEVSKNSFYGTMINHEMLKMWDVNEEELFNLAKKNTPVLMPLKIMSMQEALNGIIPFEIGMGEKCLDIMYVLTNIHGINGASCILYPEVLPEFAKQIDEDFYIIPSSIHEMILVPKNMISDVDSMRDFVRYVNATEVKDEEVLSETIYYYNRRLGKIEVA